MTDPTIAIVGVGAIGGSVAAALGNAGRDVTLCVRTPFERLSVELESRTETFSHKVCTDASAIGSVDWLLLCTKAHQVEGAADWLATTVSPSTTVAVLQNGVEHEMRLHSGLIDTAATVLPCVVRLPATAIRPGHIVQNRRGRLQVPVGESGASFARLFEGQIAITVEQVEDFKSAAWDKLVRKHCIRPLCSHVATNGRARQT